MYRKVFSGLFVVVAVAAIAVFGTPPWNLVVPQPQRVAPEVSPLPEAPQPIATPEVRTEPSPVVVQPLPSISVQKYQVDEAAEAAATLERYRQTCAFWSSRSGDAAGRIFRTRACKQMRDYAKSTGQRAPVVKIQKRSKATARKPERKTRRVVPKECTQHEYGSVRFRQCRAQESQRLKKMCQFHQQREERTQAAEWCAAYESYQIVK